MDAIREYCLVKPIEMMSSPRTNKILTNFVNLECALEVHVSICGIPGEM